MAIRVLALAAACAPSPNAWAQRAAGPFAGLFGGEALAPQTVASAAPRTTQQLSIRWSAYEGYDDLPQDSLGNVVQESEFQKSGQYGGFSASLAFQRKSGAAHLAWHASATARSYGSAFALSAPAYTAGGSAGLPLGRRMTIRTSAGASFSSIYQFSPFLAVLSPDAVTFSPGYGSVAAARETVVMGANVGVSQELWSRAFLTADAGWYRREFVASSDAPLEARSGGFMLTQSLSRGLGIHAGYNFQEGLFGAVQTDNAPTIKNLDVGVDYSKPLSFSRRTTMTFGTGSSLAESSHGSQYRLNAQAALTEQLGRTWSATLSYARGTQFVEGLRDLVYADSVSGSVHGQMSSRVELTGSVATSNGTVGLKTLAPAFSSYSGSSKLSVAFTHLVGVYVQYTYYHYDVPPGSPTALEFTPRLNRQSAMIGLTGWLPLVGDSRGSRGSR